MNSTPEGNIKLALNLKTYFEEDFIQILNNKEFTEKFVIGERVGKGSFGEARDITLKMPEVSYNLSQGEVTIPKSMKDNVSYVFPKSIKPTLIGGAKKKLNYRNSEKISKKNIQTGGGIGKNDLMIYIQKNILEEEIIQLDKANQKQRNININLNKSNLGKRKLNKYTKFTLNFNNNFFNNGDIEISKEGNKGKTLSKDNKELENLTIEDYKSFIVIDNIKLIPSIIVTPEEHKEFKEKLIDYLAVRIKKIVFEFLKPDDEKKYIMKTLKRDTSNPNYVSDKEEIIKLCYIKQKNNYTEFSPEIKNIICIEDTKTSPYENGSFIIIMEKMHKTLENVIIEEKNSKDSKTFESIYSGYIIPLLEIYQKLHENDIVHRDIKNLNIMRDKKEQFKIIDFGTSEIKGTYSSNHCELTGNPSTSDFSIMNTEVQNEEGCKHKKVTENIFNILVKTDIFSLIIVIYEILYNLLIPLDKQINDIKEGIEKKKKKGSQMMN